VFRVFVCIKRQVFFSFHMLQVGFLQWIKPPPTSLLLGTLTDLTRGKAELLAENALLLLVLLARMVRTWKQALFLVQPETLLRLPP
jgi:putative transposase